MSGINVDWKCRAEAAEAELAKLRKQKPIKYLYRVTDCFGHDVLRDDPKGATILETIPLYAEPIPVPAPAVPNDIRSAVCSMLCALDAAIAGDSAHYINKSERARSVSKNWNAANVARAKVVSLLQSAEVRHY